MLKIQAEGHGRWSMGYGRGGRECSEKELEMNTLWYSVGLQREGVVVCESLVETNPGVLPADLVLTR